MAACAATPSASLFSNGSMDIGSNNTMSVALSSSVPASELHRHMGGGAQRFGMFKVPSLVFDIEVRSVWYERFVTRWMRASSSARAHPHLRDEACK